MPDLSMITDWLLTYIPKVVAAGVIFVVGRILAAWIARVTMRLMERHRVEETLMKFLRNIIYYALLVVVVISALNQLGVNTTSFMAVLGAAGLAVGLALKDSLSNFSSGVMLILFRPFKLGDFVEAGGVTGTVKEISIFNTELATPDNQKVIVPNSSIMGNVITNVTAHDTRRVDIVMGIGYGDDIGKARDIMADVLRAESRVLADPEPQIAVAELADSSVNFVVRPWTKTEDYWAVKFALLEEIKRRFDEAGISIPYPQQDVHLFKES